MASSQVEIPSPSQRFGLILRDRNQNAVFSQKNLKALVKDHNQLFKSPVNDENSVDSWIESQNKKSNSNNRIRLTEKPIVRNSSVLVSRKEKSEESKINGASSLVQIWEARLNRSNGGNSPSHIQSTVSSSRSDSESADELEVAEAKSPDRTVEIESSSQGSVSDSRESNSRRVADLIRRLSNEEKLTAGDNGGGGNGLAFIRTPRPCITSSEKTNFPVVHFSPRIRGRQAFTDLLIQMERDRYKELDAILERNAVSRFTQRGRLQSMLRLRNLKRCLAIQDRNRSNAKTTGLNRIESGSTVLHLREKFRANVVNAVAAADQKKDHHRSAEKNNKAIEETKRPTESKKVSKNSGITLEAFFAERLSLRNRKIEEATLIKEEETVNVTVEAKMNCLEMQETRKAEETCNDREAEKKGEEKRLREKQSEIEIGDCMQETPETQTQGVLQHESNEMDQCLGEQETSYLNDGWEEQEEYEDEQYYYGETNNDWLTEISRPRSHWEELRKSRYLEVMNTRSEKEDIRRLLERRTVTDFLESGLREKIDSLMMSRVHTHPNKQSEKWGLQQEEEKIDIEEVEEEQDDRDDSSRSSSSHMFASSPAGSWSSQDTGVTSSTPVLSVHSPHSPEMELISGMRSQIQQLQQEMSLLRDSVKTCLDANATLQHAVRENPLKRKCCVCDETQVEAVLYKCGHMCTCLKCANELHWSGGKCPICRAHIVNVVRVFFDTRN
ncbi:unnamed protein product [Microthlaspi erraticum]|uniref:RING-type domain-containing protein n=1 Tax=Microthlaspi erraticum TaxID=1685480 RepID=A0A6D2HG34_9BRAS|nr:unnamed protein product [Microthlaspi erraticum]